MAERGDEWRRLSTEMERLSAEVDNLRRRVAAMEAGKAVASDSPPPEPRQFGLTAVNRIGALTLAIGIIFFFKYAVDNAWIGQNGRIALGLVAGLLLIAAAEWLRSRAQIVFSQGIAGCGLATLFITFYAAFAWYDRLSPAIAMIALVAVAGFAVLLSLRYEHPAIAALGFTGGLLTPMLLERDLGSVYLILLYVALIDVTGVAIAFRRQWPVLAVVAGVESLLTALYLTRDMHRDIYVLFAFVMAAVRFGAASSSRDTRRLHEAFLMTAHGFIIVGMLREIDLWTERTIAAVSRRGAESEFTSLFLAAYGIGALTFSITRRSALVRTLGLTLIAIVITKLYLWDVWFLERLYRMSAFGVLGILLLAASWIYSRVREQH